MDLEKILKKVVFKQNNKQDRLLKSLEPWEIWNEFSHSNMRLNSYNG